VSEFKRGGVNWAYKIFTKEADLQCNRGENKKLILSETDWFYLKQIDFIGNRLIFQSTLAQTKLDQQGLDQPTRNAQWDWLTFNILRNTDYTTMINQFYLTQISQESEQILQFRQGKLFTL